ncbi:ribbon-helix-helix protein, CopG family [Georgenia yuyongxinii]
MSRLGHRLQVLIDAERYARLEREAAQSGRSVGAIVRDAIDIRYDAGFAARAAAGRRLIADFVTTADPEPDWAESKAALVADLDAKLP